MRAAGTRVLALLAVVSMGAGSRHACLGGCRTTEASSARTSAVFPHAGWLRLRGGGQGPGPRSRKRGREQDWSEEESSSGRDSEPPKRARVGVLMSSALSTSYNLASMPFRAAYYVCAGVLAAPQAAVSYLLPKSNTRRLSDTEMLRFDGDEDKPGAVKRQIAFYFSDSNLPFDSFLKGQMAKDSLGRVSLHVIASFKRMRILGASVEDLAEAARSVDFLEVREHVQPATPCAVRDVSPSDRQCARP
jgi:hypothetical protein